MCPLCAFQCVSHGWCIQPQIGCLGPTGKLLCFTLFPEGWSWLQLDSLSYLSSRLKLGEKEGRWSVKYVTPNHSNVSLGPKGCFNPDSLEVCRVYIFKAVNSIPWDGTPKIPEFMIRNCVFILTCLNFSHLQSTLHLMQYTYWDVFPTAQNSFWTNRFWCFSVFLPFLFHLFHIGKTLPFEDFFPSGETKRSWLEWDQVNREGGAQRSCYLWSKTAEHSLRCGQVRL